MLDLSLLNQSSFFQSTHKIQYFSILLTKGLPDWSHQFSYQTWQAHLTHFSIYLSFDANEKATMDNTNCIETLSTFSFFFPFNLHLLAPLHPCSVCSCLLSFLAHDTMWHDGINGSWQFLISFQIDVETKAIFTMKGGPALMGFFSFWSGAINLPDWH